MKVPNEGDHRIILGSIKRDGPDRGDQRLNPIIIHGEIICSEQVTYDQIIVSEGLSVFFPLQVLAHREFMVIFGSWVLENTESRVVESKNIEDHPVRLRIESETHPPCQNPGVLKGFTYRLYTSPKSAPRL